MIKAPYNFVPLAQKVVFPDWALRISIDHPFEDGISGTINVKYTAQTPVFIGNGKSNNNAPIPNYKAANGKYAIPGSSLRGMLRNVIEIASFGKFNRVSDAALSVRDLTNAAKDLYRSHFTNKSIKGGWLIFESGRWVVYPTGYYRVEDRDVEECYGLRNKTLQTRDEAENRIKFLKNIKVFFSEGAIKVSRIKTTQYPGAKFGYTVLTGHPGGKKHLDFIFEDKSGKKIELEYETILKFKQTNASKSSDQKRGLDLTRKLNDCRKFGYPGIPVFYLPKADGTPDSLGLSMMYRLPYKNTLHEAIKHSSENNFSDKLDFAECMFGKIEDTKAEKSSFNFSLRGRVQFEDAITDSVSLSQQVNTVLGNPKPTYYPNYIQQNERNSDYKTLMDSDVVLRGWKRYPVKDKTNPISVGQDQKNVASHFIPLNTGTVFEGKIHFHNLKKEELGALLWAITWGGDKNLSHAVGMGKPYGFGQIKADISSLSYLRNDSEDNNYKESSSEELKVWIDDFSKFMESAVVGWKQTSPLRELIAMANPANAKRNGWDLSHMNLKNESGKNEFVEVKSKDSKFFLAPYSQDKQESRLSNSNGQQGGHGNKSQQKQAFSENGIANNSIQVCVLLEEKTKKGGWKAAVKDTPEICGPITNTADIPSDKNPGDEIKLKIVAVKGNQTSFRYEKSV